jgi:site-specific DNA-cytosine methylase
VATLFFTKAKRAQNVNDYESWIAGGVVPTLNAMDNNGEAFATVLAVDFYNASTSDVSQTIKAHTATAVNIGGVIDHQVVRRLTPVECERLQGFPDNWTDGQADSNRYKQMGNAVAVPVVEWIISRMVGEDETN